MDVVILNKKTVRTNKAIRSAQKEAKKYFGRVKGEAPKTNINKFVSVKNKTVAFLTEEKQSASNTSIDGILSYEKIVTVLRDNQLTGLSGNGFSVADKLEAFRNAESKQRCLLINSVECDPGLIHDEWILEHKLEQVMHGVRVLDDIFHFEKRVIATKSEVNCNDSMVEIKKVPNRYPMGAEKFLVENCFHIKVQPNELPIQYGILVMNIQTVLMVGALIIEGKKFNYRYLTVADFINGEAVVVRADLGASAESVLKKCMPQTEGKTVYIGSGAMSCHELATDEKITATTNFITRAQPPAYEEAKKCKGCGACTSACPMKIKVHKIVQGIEKGKTLGLESYHPENCIQCGACTYVCRAGKDTRRMIKETLSSYNLVQ